MNIKTLVLILSALLFISACDGGGSSKVAGNGQVTATKAQKVSSGFILDGQGGLFKNLKWYSYEMSTHGIWTHFDVYGIKSAGELFKLQILNYYNPNNTNLSGYYTLRVQKNGDVQPKILEVDASACGNPYTNPNFDACFSNPNENVFTYLNLESGRNWRMTDAQALANTEWHIGFKGTDIILNSGSLGPGDVVGTLLYRDQNLFLKDGTASIPKLQVQLRSGAPLEAFTSTVATSSVSFYPPEGYDRVIFETYWYKEVDLAREVISENWWIVRSKEIANTTRFFVSKIETLPDDNIELELSYQKESLDIIQSHDTETWTLLFNPKTELKNVCLDFETELEVDCRATPVVWDVKFLAVPSPDGVTSAQWRIFTNNGAMGPFNGSDLIDLEYIREAL